MEALMDQLKVAHVCQSCGKTYTRPVLSADDRQDLREGIRDGACDECWHMEIVHMMARAVR